MASSWSHTERGAVAFQRLHRTLTLHGLATPVLPTSVIAQLVVGTDGWQVTTDPKPGSPYLCKSFWDDQQGPPQLFANLIERTDPYFLFGEYSGGVNTYFTMAVRCDDFVLLGNCRERSLVNRFVAACSEFLERYWEPGPLRPLTSWTWLTNNGRLHAGLRSSGTAPSNGIDYLDQPGWAFIVSEDRASTVEQLDRWAESSDAVERRTAEFGRSFIDSPAPPAPVAPAQPNVKAIAKEAATAAAEAVASHLIPYTHAPLGDDLISLISWRLFSELLRLHPAEIEIYMDWYPTGAPMLSASRKDGRARISLNHGASLWAWSDVSHRNAGSIWETVMNQGVRPVLAQMESLLGLDHVADIPSTSSKTIGPRVLAALLAQTTLSTREWHVSAVTEVGEWSNAPQALLHLARRAGMEAGDTVGEITLPYYWALANHEGVVALFGRDGKVVRADGTIRDLLVDYKANGRNLSALAATFEE